MINLNIAHRRLASQQLTSTVFEKPEEVVRCLGAVQAQDYYGVLWALGLRMQKASADDVERAMAEGRIVRTHPMRGTWHFVAGEDIRWLLSLTAPRMIAGSASWYRRLELDDATIAASEQVIIRTLAGGKQLTRRELAAALERAGIATQELRLTFLMMRAELDGVVVSGARRGKQFTYALLDELGPAPRVLTRDEALAELVRRYFTGHGPATAQDFAWWSSLTVADARAGLALVGSDLASEVIDGQTYWFAPALPNENIAVSLTLLLPAYDEYTVAYKDRRAVVDPAHVKQTSYGLAPTIVVNGQVVGTWKRTVKGRSITIEPELFVPLSDAEGDALKDAVGRYGMFFGESVSFQKKDLTKQMEA